MLNLEAIRNCRLFRYPFRWGVHEDPFSQETALGLARDFPRAGFQYHSHELGRFFRRPLFLLDAKGPQCTDDLSEDYRALAEIVSSEDYRSALSQLVGIDLGDAPIEASFWRYDHGVTFVPHLDLAGKIVTQVFYLNEQWPRAWGGALRLLTGNDMESSAFEITPHAGLSTIIVRSEDSWHGITPISEQAKESRNTLTVHFYRSNPEMIARGIELSKP